MRNTRLDLYLDIEGKKETAEEGKQKEKENEKRKED